MNKRGQDVVQGFGINGIILIIFLVLVIGAIWYFVGYSKSVSQNLPGQAQIIIAACDQLTTPQFQDSYCNQIRQIRTNEYTTCDYANNYGLVLQDVATKNAACVSANTQNPSARAIRFRDQCISMGLDDNKDKIDGSTCGYWKTQIGSVTGSCNPKSTTTNAADIAACQAINVQTDCNINTNCVWSTTGSCKAKTGVTDATLAGCGSITAQSACNANSFCSWG